MTEIGNLYVVAAPSGTGKTTLVKALIESVPKISVSISYTTRMKRPNETPDLNYHFIDKVAFENMIHQRAFLEYAKVFDHYYGTSKMWVKDTLAKGMDVILEIDWQGNQQIKHLFPHVISIFLLPPSLSDLKKRLETRNQDHPDIIKKRLTDAKEAVSHINEFDFVVINDKFSEALHDLTLIVEATRLKQTRQTNKLVSLIKEFAKIGSQ